MKYCPNCGAGVEAGAGSCESCDADLSAVRSAMGASFASPPRPATGVPLRVTDLTPRQLRREIRWGAFQGILLAAAIGLAVYLVIVLIVFGALLGGGAVID